MEGLQRALDNDTYPTIKPGKHYIKVLLYVCGEGMCNLGMDICTQPPTCMQPPMNMHMPEYGACLWKATASELYRSATVGVYWRYYKLY